MIRKILCVCFVVLLLSGCGAEDNQIPTTDQAQCEHVWMDIYHSMSYVEIYCPACKLEQSVTNREWQKIRADRLYQDLYGVG